MNFQDSFAIFDIRHVDDNLAIKTAGTQESGIKHIRTIGSGHDNDVGLIVEAIHLHQDLIQRLLPFIMRTAQASTALSADSIYFINEDNARSFFASFLKQVADARGADTDKHLNEFRT